VSHRRYLELAAGGALDDLEPDERALLEQHLAECGSCRLGARDIGEVVTALGMAAPRRAVPTDTWGSILSAIREAPSGSSGSSGSPATR
jgi:predicted anti-sigma-YlaC factor YlaD